MEKQLELFKKIAQTIIENIRQNRPVSINPNLNIADAFQFAIDYIDKDQERLYKIKTRGGRPRKPESELSRNALNLRKSRAKLKAAQNADTIVRPNRIEQKR